MKFVSSGHCTTPGPNFDPGAPGVNKRWEANETLRVRNRVIEFLQHKGATDIVKDMDSESLQQYLNRIKPGNGSVVCEFHFNAGPENATGVEVLVEVDADKLDKLAAKEFAVATSEILGIPLRSGGVKSESDTRHKRLALMKEEGIIILVEICFISNPEDMAKFDANFDTLCERYADLLIKFDNLIV